MDLLAPDTRQIAPEGSDAAEDRVPDDLASGTPEPLRGELIDLLGDDRVLTRVIDLVRYASDEVDDPGEDAVVAEEIDQLAAQWLGRARGKVVGHPVLRRVAPLRRDLAGVRRQQVHVASLVGPRPSRTSRSARYTGHCGTFGDQKRDIPGATGTSTSSGAAEPIAPLSASCSSSRPDTFLEETPYASAT